MIVLNKEDKNLTIPKSLGNFGTNGEGGSGVTPEEVEEIVSSAITEYDENTVQEYVATLNSGITNNSSDIDALSAKTVEIENNVSILSGATSQITGMSAQIEALSGGVSANTTNVETLSGITSGISNDLTSLGNDVEALSGATAGIENDVDNLGTRVENLSGVSSAISADLQALSGATEGIAQTLGDKANASDLQALSAATSGVAVDLETLSAYTATISSDANVRTFFYPNYTANTAQLFTDIKAAYDNGYDCILVGYSQYDTNDLTHLFLIKADASSAVFTGTKLVNNVYNNQLYTYKVSIYNDGATSGIANKLFVRQNTISNYTLPTASSSTLGGVKVGSGLTIDGNGVLSVSGGTSGPTVIDFDAMSQVELTSLYGALSGATSADSINSQYMFYKTFNEGSIGPLRLQFMQMYFGRAIFSAAFSNFNDPNVVWNVEVWLTGEGTLERSELQGVRGNVTGAEYANNFFQSDYVDCTFYKLTSAFTATQYGTPYTITDNTPWPMDALLYWKGGMGDDWDNKAIMKMRLRVVDENSVETSYYWPSIYVKPVSETIGDVEFTQLFTLDYGPISVRFYANGTPQLANMRFIENY